MAFTLKTVDEAGREELWSMEGAPVYYLQRGGVTPDLFTVGDRVRVAGQKTLQPSNDFRLTNMLLPDGREVLLLSMAPFRWTDDGLGARSEWADEDQLRDAANIGEGIFRVWSIPKENEHVTHQPFTEAAIAARQGWNREESYQWRCEPEGMPAIMTSNHPFEFVDQGTEILLSGELDDIVRTIHMDGAARAEVEPPSHLGYSVGTWEGDTLVVETTRINWPYFDADGTPQSDEVRTVERFTLSEDQTRLDYHLTVTDTTTFTEPATLQRHWLALGETVEPYDCQIR